MHGHHEATLWLAGVTLGRELRARALSYNALVRRGSAGELGDSVTKSRADRRPSERAAYSELQEPQQALDTLGRRGRQENAWKVRKYGLGARCQTLWERC